MFLCVCVASLVRQPHIGPLVGIAVFFVEELGTQRRQRYRSPGVAVSVLYRASTDCGGFSCSGIRCHWLKVIMFPQWATQHCQTHGASHRRQARHLHSLAVVVVICFSVCSCICLYRSFCIVVLNVSLTVITGCTPDRGSTAGNTRVTISGSDLSVVGVTPAITLGGAAMTVCIVCQVFLSLCSVFIFFNVCTRVSTVFVLLGDLLTPSLVCIACLWLGRSYRCRHTVSYRTRHSADSGNIIYRHGHCIAGELLYILAPR